MQRIRFTYTSSRTVPSVFISFFFRMIGIYVYERYFDFSKQETLHLLENLPVGIEAKDTEGGGMTGMKGLDCEYDLDLYYIEDEVDKEHYNLLIDDGQTMLERILIIKNGLEWQGIEKYIYVNDYPNESITNSVFLKNLFDDLFSKITDNQHLKQDLDLCANIFLKDKMCETSLLGKYFYAAEKEGNCTFILKAYSRAIDDIFEILHERDCSWGEEYIHLQYAVLNLAYEEDLYCIKNGRNMVFSPESIRDTCELVLKKSLDKMKGSFYLLLAQIYDNLIEDPNMAYQYYLKECKTYNAYAFYRKGLYWQDYAKDYDKAIKFYKKSICIYPVYYQAWYELGRCYMLSERSREALGMFRNVSKILKPRLDAKQMRPMEIEYMFKAQNLCGYICNDFLGNPRLAIIENLKAEEAWDTIEKSVFFHILPKEKLVRNSMKKKLNIAQIYRIICKLAVRIDDEILRRIYLEKLNKHEEEKDYDYA